MAEIATSNSLRDALALIRRNVDMNRHRIQDLDKIVFNDVVFPDVGSFEVRAELVARSLTQPRTRTFQELPQNQQFKTRVI